MLIKNLLSQLIKTKETNEKIDVAWELVSTYQDFKKMAEIIDFIESLQDAIKLHPKDSYLKTIYYAIKILDYSYSNKSDHLQKEITKGYNNLVELESECIFASYFLAEFHSIENIDSYDPIKGRKYYAKLSAKGDGYATSCLAKESISDPIQHEHTKSLLELSIKQGHVNSYSMLAFFLYDNKKIDRDKLLSYLKKGVDKNSLYCSIIFVSMVIRHEDLKGYKKKYLINLANKIEDMHKKSYRSSLKFKDEVREILKWRSEEIIKELLLEESIKEQAKERKKQKKLSKKKAKEIQRAQEAQEAQEAQRTQDAQNNTELYSFLKEFSDSFLPRLENPEDEKLEERISHIQAHINDELFLTQYSNSLPSEKTIDEYEHDENSEQVIAKFYFRT